MHLKDFGKGRAGQGSSIWTCRPSSFLGLYDIRIPAPVYQPEHLLQITVFCQSSFQKKILEAAITIFIFSAGLLVPVVLLVHFAFLSFCTSFHTTSSHVQHVGISRLWLLCQQPDFHISCRCLWEHLSDDESTLSNLPLKSEAINVGSTYSFLSNIFLFLDSINNLRIIFYDSGAAIQ